MALILHARKSSIQAFKVLIVAEYCRVQVQLAPNSEMGVTNDESREYLDPAPVLVTPDGAVTMSNAIARYVARLNGQNRTLLGSSLIDKACVDQWIDFATTEIAPTLFQLRQKPHVHERVGHDHLQGYLHCKGNRTLKQVLRLFSPHHPPLEKQRALKNEEARKYCSKEDSRVAGPWEFGEFVAQGSNKRKVMDHLEDPNFAIEEPTMYRRALGKKIADRSNQWALANPFSFNLKLWQ